MKIKRIHKSNSITLDTKLLTNSIPLLGNDWKKLLEESTASYYWLTDHKYHTQKYVVSIRRKHGVIELMGKIPLCLMLEDQIKTSDFYNLQYRRNRKSIEVYSSHSQSLLRDILMLAYNDMNERSKEVTFTPEAKKVFKDTLGQSIFF